MLLTILHIIFLQVQPEKALLLQSEKIYAVLAVVLVIFGTLAVFMFRTQLKIQALEKEINKHN